MQYFINTSIASTVKSVAMSANHDVCELATLLRKCIFLCNMKDIASPISSNEF
jgi:hypothetical protein